MAPHMHPIESRLDTSSSEFASDVRFMEQYVERVRTVLRKQDETEHKYLPRARQKGKLLPTERLELLTMKSGGTLHRYRQFWRWFLPICFTKKSWRLRKAMRR